MKIILCSDHAGFNLKQKIKQHLNRQEILDVGSTCVDPLDSYVDFAKKANAEVVKNSNNIGIYVCGSGVGMSIVANKQKGIRAVNASSEEIAQKAREHNNANVLCLGERFVDSSTALKIVDKFLSTNFLGGKYQDRIESIEN